MPFDFEHAVQTPFRMQPGLRRIAPGARQLTPNHPGSRHLLTKLEVLSTRPASALVSRPGFDAAPALQQLSAQAATEHPQAWRIAADGAVSASLLGWSEHDGQMRAAAGAHKAVGDCLHGIDPPLRRAALLALAFAEDFAIADANDFSIPWLAVALPSHWSPEQKAGLSFAEVHRPVADNRLLIATSEHLLRLVTGADRWERFVWTIARSGRLDAHPQYAQLPAWRSDAGADEIAAAAWWRTEHQTFIPVPGLRQAVFTIHVETEPLQAAIDTRAKALALCEALCTMSPAVLDYRGLTPVRDRLLVWLATRVAALPAA
jgi:hypothetical protein